MIKFHIDTANPYLIEGWAFSERSPVQVAIAINDLDVATLEPSLARRDVAEDHGNATHSDISGFRCVLDEKARDVALRGPATARIVISELDSETPDVTQIVVELGGMRDFSYVGVDPRSDDSLCGPLPSYVLKWLWHIDREAEYLTEGWSDSTACAAVDRLLHLYQTTHIPDLQRYFGLLARSWLAIKYIELRFPYANSSRAADAKDFRAIQSSVAEMFAISHHVAVLSSYGLRGPLLEFGCFKGFSTSALSHMCREVGWRMEVFDSFQGLPPSDSSGYAEGDFAGSLDEVRRNVDSYGCLDVVRFHKGYFSQTVPGYRMPEVGCIWVDVDLELSARDAMRTLPMLSRRGCVFSHECEPAFFVEGRVEAPERGPDYVVPPILDAFESAGRQPAGRFIHGQTGAFWDAERGIPVLPTDQLLRLKDAAIRGL